MKKKLEDYMDWPKIEDLEYAECRNVEDVLGAAVVEIGPDIAHVLGEVVGVRHAAIVPLQPAPQVTLAHGGSFLRWVGWSDSPLRRPRWQGAPPW